MVPIFYSLYRLKKTLKNVKQLNQSTQIMDFMYSETSRCVLAEIKTNGFFLSPTDPRQSKIKKVNFV